MQAQNTFYFIVSALSLPTLVEIFPICLDLRIQHQNEEYSMQISGTSSLYSSLFLKLQASLVAQMVKNLPAVWETWVQFLGWEDPPEKGTAVHSSVLAWRIPWAEEPGRLHSPWGHKELDTTEQLSPFFLKLHFPVFIVFTSLKFYLCLFR